LYLVDNYRHILAFMRNVRPFFLAPQAQICDNTRVEVDTPDVIL